MRDSGQQQATGWAETGGASRDAAGDAAGGAGRRQASDGVEDAGGGLAVASLAAGGGDAGEEPVSMRCGQQSCMY